MGPNLILGHRDIGSKKFIDIRRCFGCDKNNSKILSASDKEIIRKMINKLSIKEIIILINKDNQISKKEIYNYCLKL